MSNETEETPDTSQPKDESGAATRTGDDHKAATKGRSETKPEKPSMKKAAKKKPAKKNAKKKTAKKPSGTRTKKAASSGAANADGGSKKRVNRSYPVLPLEEAVVLAQAIRKNNNGHPWDTDLAAKAALHVKKSNNKFFYLAAASRDYDLTIGSRDTDKVELSDLGRRVVFAGSEQDKQQALVDAFFSVDVFKRVFDHYGGGNLPEKEFLANTLFNDFGIDPTLHDEFATIFKANCAFLNITEGLTAGLTKRNAPEDDTGTDVRVVGQPKGKFDRTAFVIMPFSEKGTAPAPKGSSTRF